MSQNKFLIAFFLLFFVGFSAHSQALKVPTVDMSSQVLGILNKTDGMSLTGDQKSKLSANNKSFVDQLFKISGGKDSDDSKKASILDLKNSRTKILTDVLGSDLFSKYSGSVLKAINPLKSKLGLAALGF